MASSILSLAPLELVKQSIVDLGEILPTKPELGDQVQIVTSSPSFSGHVEDDSDLLECQHWLQSWLNSVVVQTLCKLLNCSKSALEQVRKVIPLIGFPTRLACVIQYYAPRSSVQFGPAGRLFTAHLNHYLTALRGEPAPTDYESLLFEDDCWNCQAVLHLVKTSPNIKPASSISVLEQFSSRSVDQRLSSTDLVQELRLVAEFFHWLLPPRSATDSLSVQTDSTFLGKTRECNYSSPVTNGDQESASQQSGALQLLVQTSSVVARPARPAHPNSRPVALLNTSAVEHLVSSSTSSVITPYQAPDLPCSSMNGTAPTSSKLVMTPIQKGSDAAVESSHPVTQNGSASARRSVDPSVDLLMNLVRTASRTDLSSSTPSQTGYFVNHHGSVSSDGRPCSSEIANPIERNKMYATFRTHPTPALSNKLPKIGSPTRLSTSRNGHLARSTNPSASREDFDPQCGVLSLRSEFEKRKRSHSALTAGKAATLSESLPPGTTTWAASANACRMHARKKSAPDSNLESCISSSSGGTLPSEHTVSRSSSTALRLSLDQRRRAIEMGRKRALAATNRAAIQRHHAAFQRIIHSERRRLTNEQSPDVSEATTADSQVSIGQSTAQDAVPSELSNGAEAANQPLISSEIPDASFTAVDQATDVEDDFSLRSSSTVPPHRAAASESPIPPLSARIKLDSETTLTESDLATMRPVSETPVGNVAASLPEQSAQSMQLEDEIENEPASTTCPTEEDEELEQVVPVLTMGSSPPSAQNYVLSSSTQDREQSSSEGNGYSLSFTSERVRKPTPVSQGLNSRVVQRRSSDRNGQSGQEARRSVARPPNQSIKITRTRRTTEQNACLPYDDSAYSDKISPPPLAYPNGPSNSSYSPNTRRRTRRPRSRGYTTQSLVSDRVNPVHDHSRRRRRPPPLSPNHLAVSQDYDWDAQYSARYDEPDEGGYDEEESTETGEDSDGLDDQSYPAHGLQESSLFSDRSMVTLPGASRRSHRHHGRSHRRSVYVSGSQDYRYPSPARSYASISRPPCSEPVINPAALDELSRNLANLQTGLERLSLQQQVLMASSSATAAALVAGAGQSQPVQQPPPQPPTPVPNLVGTTRATWSDRPKLCDLSTGPPEVPSTIPDGVQEIHPENAVQESVPAATSTTETEFKHPPKKNTNCAFIVDMATDSPRSVSPGSAQTGPPDAPGPKPKHPMAPSKAQYESQQFYIGFDQPNPQLMQRKFDRLEARRAAEKAASAQQLESLRIHEREEKLLADQALHEKRLNAKDKREAILQAHLERKEASEPHGFRGPNPYPVRPGSAALSRSEANLVTPGRERRSASQAVISKLTRTKTTLEHVSPVTRHRVRSATSRSLQQLSSIRSSGDGQAVEANEAEIQSVKADKLEQSKNGSRSTGKPLARLPSGLSLSSLHRLGAADLPSSGPGVTVPGQPRLFVKPKAKSNRMVIVNAIGHCCLAGAVNEPMKQATLKELAATEGTHFMILFRDSRCQYRAVYQFDLETEELHLICGTGPRKITHEMANRFFKYNSGGKRFTEIKSTNHLSPVVDAITIHDALWSKSSGQSAALNLISGKF
ncbi:unnamed protein product [Calicophoron daubneyi]|uniref:CKK domain-containing protein n=1 Tax=Calicophoron daubneyi TaxID=300641 RepID=A0AAV2TMJ5_CALDB